MKKLTLSAVALAVAALLLGACGSHDMGSMDTGDSTQESAAFNDADVMFAQMMIPHHEQAVVMSDLALSTSKDAEVLKLAKQIKDAQAPEIIKMQGWLSDAGLSEDPGHSMGNGMGGMLSDSDLSFCL